MQRETGSQISVLGGLRLRDCQYPCGASSQTPDVVAYQKLGTSGQHEHGRGSIRFKTAASIIVFAAITYWGSFHLAYGDSKICNSQYLVLVVVGYAQVFGVSVARGLLAFLFCHFYFMSLDTAPDRKSTE